MPELFHRLPRNVITIFSGRNLWWHALAIGLTAGIVTSGLDWSYYLPDHALSPKQAARFPCTGLRALCRHRHLGIHPLVLRVCSRSYHWKCDWKGRRRKFQTQGKPKLKLPTANTSD